MLSICLEGSLENFDAALSDPPAALPCHWLAFCSPTTSYRMSFLVNQMRLKSCHGCAKCRSIVPPTPSESGSPGTKTRRKHLNVRLLHKRGQERHLNTLNQLDIHVCTSYSVLIIKLVFCVHCRYRSGLVGSTARGKSRRHNGTYLMESVLVAGKYVYLQDLEVLDQRIPPEPWQDWTR